MNKITELEIRNSGVPLVLEARTGSNVLHVNQAFFEDWLTRRKIGGCECLTLFNFYDDQGNYIGSQVWDRSKEPSNNDDYYIVGEALTRPMKSKIRLP